MENLQIYWWFIISLLGGLLVALLFVQGGQTLLLRRHITIEEKPLMVNALGRKWELTFTTLVTFGGAYFASFPLYYSTSFGGAYWLWMLILVSFILQAVSYEFRSKPGNIFGTMTYDIFLGINGFVGCVLLGVAVGMQFFGAEFTVVRQNILNAGSPVISTWNDMHGFNEIFSLRCLLLGVAVYFLARMLGAMFFRLSIKVPGDKRWAYMQTIATFNGVMFVLCFLAFLYALFTADGYTLDPEGLVVAVPNKYLWNFIELWWIGGAFVIGVLLVLWGVVRNILSARDAFWWCAAGVVIAVTCLLLISGYNNTAFLPSTSDPQSSLFITNASSSEFTLRTMAWVSILVPVVVAYIAWVWKKMTTPPLTAGELGSDEHKY